MGKPAEGEVGAGEDAVLHLDNRRDGDEREGVGGSLAHLAVELRSADGRGQRYRGDDLARLQHIVAPRRIAGEAMKIAHRDGAFHTVAAGYLNAGVQRAQRHGHVAGIGGDAFTARTQHGVQLCDSVQRAAAAARLALVAGLVDIHEVVAARALAQVAAGRRLVAQLLGRPGEDRAGQDGVVGAHAGVDCSGGIGGQRADAQAAAIGVRNLAEAHAVDVRQLARRFHLQLHQVEQVRAAGDGHRILALRDLHGVGQRPGAVILERPHAPSSAATPRMAATIFA